MAFLLGIDIGTSSTKTVLFDETGTPLYILYLISKQY